MPRYTSICLDSNILIALRNKEPTADAIARILRTVPRLVVCAPVVAELTPGDPHAEEWLRQSGIEVDWDLGRASWKRVAEAHAEYVTRCRTSGGNLPRRVVTDHLIGAYAEVNGLPLFTRNTGDFSAFTALELVPF